MPARKNHAAADDQAVLLDTILNTTDIMIAYFDRSFNFIRVNRAYARADKKPVSFFPGKNHFDLYPDTENEKIFRRAVRTGKPYRAAAKPFEYPEYPARGISYWDWSLQPVKRRGRVTGLVLSLRDVTGQVRQRIAADRDHVFLNTIIDQTPNPMWVSDDTGLVIRMNRALERMLKLKKKDVVGTYNVLKDVQVKKQGYLPAVRNVYRKGKTARFLLHYDTGTEPQLHTRMPAYRIIEIVISPVRDTAGTVTHAICMQKDITARLQGEQEREQLNSFYTDLLGSMREGLWVTDRRDRMMFFNKGMEKIAGVVEKDVLGLSLLKDFPPETAGELIPVYRKAKRTLKAQPYEAHVVTPAGRATVQSGWLVPRHHDGAYDGMICSILDVTEQKTAEKALRESEEKYATLVDHSRDGVLVVQGNRLVFANKSLCRMSGYPLKELLRMPALDLIPPDQQQLIADRYTERMKGNSVPDAYEIEIIHKRGHRVPVFTSAERIVYNGEPSVMGYLRDISLEKASEARIRAERDRAQRYLDLAEVMFVALDTRGRITMVNRKACAILGRAEDELLGKSWFANCIPARMRKEVRSIAQQVLREETGPVEYHENPVLTVDGRERLIAWHNAIIRDDAGNCTGVLSAGTDITDLMATRAQVDEYRQLLERTGSMAHVGGWELEVATGSVTWTEETYRIHEVDPDFDPNLHDALAFFPAEERPQLERMIDRAIKHGEPYDAEFRFVTGKGHHRWTRSICVPEQERGRTVRLRGTFQDITVQKNAETGLQRSQYLLARAQELGSIGTWKLDIPGNVLTWTDEAYRIFGVQRGAPLSYQTFLDCIHPDDRDFVNREWTARVKSNDYDIEHRVVANGRVRWVREKADITFDDAGHPVLATGFTQDITVRKTAELELQESETRYRELVEHAGSIILRITDKGVVMFVNEYAQRFFGYPAKDLLGKNIIGTLFPKKNESGKSMRWLPHSISRDPERFGNYEGANITRDKRRVWVAWTFRPARNAGDGGGELLCIGNDITATKRSLDAQLKAAMLWQTTFDAMNEAISFISMNGIVMKANRAMAALLGVNMDEIIGASCHQLFHKAKDYPGDCLKRTIQAGAKQAEAEIRVRNTVQRLTAGPVTDDDGTLVGMVHIMTDVTEQQRATEALRASEEKYRLLFRNMNNGFALHRIITDDAGTPVDYEFLEVNQAFEHTTGLTRKTVIGRMATQVIPGIEHDPADWIGRYGRVALSGREDTFEDHAAALEKWFSVHAYSPRRGQFATVFEDITERKVNELLLQESKAKLRSLAAHLQSVREDERGTIAREIHDELGQLLTAFKMDVSWLHRHIKDIPDSVEGKLNGMTELVDRVIGSVKRISAQLRPSLLDDLGLLPAMEWQVEEFKKHAGIPCRFYRNVQTDIHDGAFGTAMFRVFQEALTNVARHADATRASASVTERRGWLRIAVRDNGTGIDPAVTDAPGSYGLLGMQERMVAVGGTVVIRPRKGGGTEVVAEAPIVTATADSDEETHPLDPPL